MAANDAAVKKVDLILGFGYDNATLSEHRHPTRDDLDQISKDIPVLLWHQSGHIIAVNSKALVSGKRYVVRCPGRPPVESAAWLRDELARYRQSQKK